MLLCMLQLVLNTDAGAGDLRDNLSYIYGLYVEYVMKNPLYTPGDPFRQVSTLDVCQLQGLQHSMLTLWLLVLCSVHVGCMQAWPLHAKLFP